MNPIVIKVSGKVIDDPAKAQSLWHAISEVNRQQPVVLVHGGGKQVDTLLSKLGEPIERIDGIRVTPESQIDIVAGVLAGQMNLKLVGSMKVAGVKAVGLALGSHGILECEVDSAHNGKLGRVGTPIPGEASLVRSLSTGGYVPVVSSIGLDAEGGLLNVNADDAAAALAVSLSAQSLFYVSDVTGIANKKGEIIESVSVEEVEQLVESGVVVGGMAAKLRSAADAVCAGVEQIHITSAESAATLLAGNAATSTTVAMQKAGAS